MAQIPVTVVVVYRCVRVGALISNQVFAEGFLLLYLLLIVSLILIPQELESEAPCYQISTFNPT